MNINSIAKNGHLLVEHLLHKFSLTALQETKLRDRHQVDALGFFLDKKLGPASYFLAITDHRAALDMSSAGRSGGIMTLVTSEFPGFADLRHLEHLDVVDRYHVLNTHWEDTAVYLHNVYAPVRHGERQVFFESLPTSFEPDAIHIVCGDLNVALDLSLDVKHVGSQDWPGRDACLEWLSRLDVVDAWRIHNPTTRVFSGPGRLNRLDFILVDSALAAATYQRGTYNTHVHAGDHLYHVVHLGPPTMDRGKGYWKLPRELLEDDLVRATIVAEATALEPVLAAAANPGVVWSGWMKRVRKTLQTVHRHRHQAQQLESRATDQLLAMAVRDHARGTGSDAELVAARATHAAARLARRRDARDRNFDMHMTSMETSSADFFTPPRAPGQKVPITTAVDSSGHRVTSAAAVTAAFHTHWSKVFTRGTDAAPNRAQRRRLVRLLQRRLSDAQRAALAEPLADGEFVSAIRTLRRNGAPGLDGFPAEFFQLDPELFGRLLRLVFAAQRDRGQMLARHRESAVIFLFKGGDRGQPGNYRPITLMPVELKVLARVLAHRLAAVLPCLIHQMQTGFVRGRRIHDNLCLLETLQAHVSADVETEGLATLLDFSKAFDRVDWTFMVECLAAAGLPPEFIAWVQFLYSSPSVLLFVNGHRSDPIHPDRGVKQGCPLSPLLFVLTIEPLSELLRSQEDLGIQLPDGNWACGSLFADDVTLLSGSRHALELQLSLVKTYCDGSGAQLNRTKSKSVNLNNQQPVGTWPGISMVTSGTAITYLGVLFGHKVGHDRRLAALDDRFFGCFNTWGRQGRTIRGRRLLVQAVIMSTLRYYTEVTVVPPKQLQRWQAAIDRFIISRKTGTTARAMSLVSPPVRYDGAAGLRVPHVESMVAAQRLRRLQLLLCSSNDPEQPWARLARWHLDASIAPFGRPGKPDFLYYYPRLSTPLVSLKAVSPLWRDVWRHWARIPWVTKTPAAPTAEARLATWLDTPVWLQIRPELHLERSATDSTCLAVKSRYHRDWHAAVAAVGLRTLRDFCYGPGWPNLAEFTRFIDTRLEPMDIGHDRPTSLRTLYSDLTLLASRVCAASNTSVELLGQVPPSSPEPFQLAHQNGFIGLDKAPPAALQAATTTRPQVEHVARHPWWSDRRHTLDKIESSHESFLAAYGFAPPVCSDVWYRTLFRALPLNYKFVYLQTTDGHALDCTHATCFAVETEVHALWECSAVAPLWGWHLAAWSSAGIKWTWDTIIHPETFIVPRRLRHVRDVYYRLWFSLVATVLHFVWTTRNKLKYETKTPMQMPSAGTATLALWMSSVSAWPRNDPEAPRAAIDSALQHLGLPPLEIARTRCRHRPTPPAP